MFLNRLSAVSSGEVLSVIDIEIGVLRVPVGVAHFLLFDEVLLGSPIARGGKRVLGRGEGSSVLRNVHLIISHLVVDSAISLVLEPCEGYLQIVVGVNSDGELTWNGIPRVFMHFPNWSITIGHHGHFVISGGGP